MNIECPKCNSTEFTKLSLIYASGFSNLEARSRGWGLLFGNGGADVALGSFRTKGEIQTRLSQRVSPPHKWSYWKIMVGGLIGLLIFEFILGNVDTFLRMGGNFNQQLAWLGYSYLGVVASALCVAFWYNHSVIPKRHRVWDRSFMCRRCGHVLQMTATSAPTRQSRIMESQHNRLRDRIPD